jgi:hypothetical protein
MAAKVVKRGSRGSRKPSPSSGVRTRKKGDQVRDTKTGQRRIVRKKK